MKNPRKDLAVDQIVALDQICFEQTPALTGINFNTTTRKNGLLEEIDKGAGFIQVRRNNQVVAYFEYLPRRDKTWEILSVRIHPKHRDRGMYQKLIGEICAELEKKRPFIIRASAPSGDQDYIDFLNQLGLEEYDQVQGETSFRAGREAIIHASRASPTEKSP